MPYFDGHLFPMYYVTKSKAVISIIAAASIIVSGYFGYLLVMG